MLLFIAALQAIGDETEEAGIMDGASARRRFRHITVPLLPTLFAVITLGLIGTWQVFDQIAIGSKGWPGEDDDDAGVHELHTKAFNDGEWGGTAIAFILFGIIVLMTLLQRLILGEADATKTTRGDLRRAKQADARSAAAATAVATQKATSTTGGGV